MFDRLDREILEKFRRLNPENQEAILVYLATALSEPEASSSDRR